MSSSEYSAHLKCLQLTGQVKLTIDEAGLFIASLFDGIVILYSEITAIDLRDYAVQIHSDADIYTLSRFERGCEPFYNTLNEAFNKKVRKALFVTDTPVFRTRGEYRYEEEDKNVSGKAVIEVYKDCVLILPPDDGARRIPICFAGGMQDNDFELILSLGTGESYSFIRLGHDTDTFVECLADRLHFLRTRALSAVRALDGSLNSAQASAIAKLMPEGVAVPLHKLAAIAPSFVTAVEAQVSQSRVGNEYRFFKEICDPLEVCVGMKSGLAGEQNQDVLWIIAPGKKPGVAAVELATGVETAAATFMYRFLESWGVFYPALNRAMEAVNFKREIIRLTDDELKMPEYADYAMAVKRTRALRFLRDRFAGRVIHASEESWKREIVSYMNPVQIAIN
ncbi:MAG: hypothetical protein GXY50_10835 [Syntrophomonadaceae bacterium]|nr:hypothetical protein [Syntrophomonadaceae bacterium]